MITVPPNIFPNGRNVSDIGVAISLTIFKGNKNGTGSNRPFQYASPFDFIPSK